MAKWRWNDPDTADLLFSNAFRRVGFIDRLQWGPFGIGRASHFLLSEVHKDEAR